ncbi:iron-sulfur cluster carrier protein ApbC [Legionella londiniensis]|nr:iron-sulfur cluster carrier protein ApbC [Legionella londiniensis]
MQLQKKLQHILNQIQDNFLNQPLAELPIKPIITENGNVLDIHLSLGFPSHFFKERLSQTLTARLQEAFSEYEINLHIDHLIKSHRTQLPGKSLRGIKNTIAIASGKGGVGKSTVAVNLAAALVRSGARVGILDADIYGPSIPLMLGKAPPVQIEGDHYLPVLAHGIQAMSIGYLTEGDPALIWRGPMLAKSLLQMLDITRWQELDYLLIDLPPGTGDIQLSLVQKIPLTGAVIVTTPQTVATLDAQKALKMFAKTNIDVLGIIENMSQHVCSHCGFQEAIFGHDGAEKLCQSFQCPLLGQLPLHRDIGDHCEQGEPTALHGKNDLAMAFCKAALRMAVEIANKPLNYADKFPPVVVES